MLRALCSSDLLAPSLHSELIIPNTQTITQAVALLRARAYTYRDIEALEVGAPAFRITLFSELLSEYGSGRQPRHSD